MKNKVDKIVLSELPVGNCKIVICGEAPGEREALRGKPFIGSSGQLLNRALREMEIDRGSCLVTNVFRYRPIENQIKRFFDSKTQAKKSGWAKECPYPPFDSNGYVKQEYIGEIERLKKEIERVDPDIIIGLGATALWALTGETKIGNFRGVLMDSTLVPGKKVLCTFHPAAVLRQWSNLQIFYRDLEKAKEISEGRHPEKLVREIWIEPNLYNLDIFYNDYIAPLKGGSRPVGCDIETSGSQQITCVGFSTDKYRSIVVPFVDKRKGGASYWQTEEDELVAWRWINKILGDPDLPKVFHNGNYDLQWLRRWGLRIEGNIHDTMLLHHCLEPEMRKGLGFLASIYCAESAWKQMVNFKDGEEKPNA